MIVGFHAKNTKPYAKTAKSLNICNSALCVFCVFFAFPSRETYSADLQLLKPANTYNIWLLTS